MTDFPNPLTAPDCNLQGLAYMPLLVCNLQNSDFNAKATDSEFRAALNLWMAAWQQVPAASLPDDDAVLCRLAGLGRDQKAWRKVKSMGLYNFVKCNDGRLYHPVIAEQASIALKKRLDDRQRQAKRRAKLTAMNDDCPRDNMQTSAFATADVISDETGRDETGRDKAKVPSAIADGAAAPVSAKSNDLMPSKLLWDEAVGYLGENKRRIIGQWIQRFGTEATHSAVAKAKAAEPVDPLSYIIAILESQTKVSIAAKEELAAIDRRNPDRALTENDARALFNDDEFADWLKRRAG